MSYANIPKSVKQFMDDIYRKCKESNHERWGEIFNACFANTLLTTINRHEDNSTFVLTGDIPAMWLRDSTAQVRPYLVIAKEDKDLANMIAGLVKKQFEYINIDPYANAFNEFENRAGHQDDSTEMAPWIWERKYEIDSLCYPIQLSYLLWKSTGMTSQFDETFKNGVVKIIELWELEQNHANSKYSFERDTDRKEDTLSNNGLGSEVAVTGMTWSGFRPSDDCCTYHYLVPSNMLAVVVLDYLNEIYTDILNNDSLVDRIQMLRNEIEIGIKKYAVVENKEGKNIYAYEVDGLGNSSIMDDSNVPSLLSAPYLGYCNIDDETYQATRKTLLSNDNPYYYEGTHAKGIGSSHTPDQCVWPIAIAMEGLTTKDRGEKERILDMLARTDAGKNLMHESFHVEDPSNYTREWFSWANMMFCELVMDYFGIRVIEKEDVNQTTIFMQ